MAAVPKDEGKDTEVNQSALQTPPKSGKAKEGVFKSPGHSNHKKCTSQLGALGNNGAAATNINHYLKSPHLNNQAKFGHGGSNSKMSGSKLFGNNGVTGYIENNSWIISPVCSRLRDHIYHLGGGPSNQKEGGLFINSRSPMEDGLLGSNGEV
jgi:hypothetical protein